MTDVYLATCSWLSEGEPGGALLVDELARLGVDAQWVVWDDPAVDWSAARLVAVRSTWDYESRLAEFLAWARRVSASSDFVNPPGVLEWNTDKAYLVELADAGVPVVPTVTADDLDAVTRGVARYGTAVVKPRVAVGGRGVTIVAGTSGRASLPPAEEGPWVVQPLVESIRDEGETSVFVLGGQAVSQARKVPAAGEIRVHEHHGGATHPANLDEAAAGLAREAVAVTERLLGSELLYARVDMLRLPDGSLAMSELEVTEPGLYLDVMPGNAGPFVEAVARRLRGRGS
jgi:glutathione synthase/RimK-type ligase-like ATP-grasp enzyme